MLLTVEALLGDALTEEVGRQRAYRDRRAADARTSIGGEAGQAFSSSFMLVPHAGLPAGRPDPPRLWPLTMDDEGGAMAAPLPAFSRNRGGFRLIYRDI
ncbi:hypothetical protein CTI14_35820 [Methylobacterium radiotolerans]|nr:hypothetical protein CTI14_35820 [Methylobacterium radiotolerans]